MSLLSSSDEEGPTRSLVGIDSVGCDEAAMSVETISLDRESVERRETWVLRSLSF